MPSAPRALRLKVAQAEAEAAVAKDAERAQVLAKATGAELDAARRELEAIAVRRDAIYAGVGEASRKVAALEAVPLAAIGSLAVLRRIDGPAADRAAQSGADAVWRRGLRRAPRLGCGRRE